MKAESSFEAGVPKALFDFPDSGITLIREGILYDVAAGGQRFLVIRPTGSGNSEPITVVLNWAAERKR